MISFNALILWIAFKHKPEAGREVPDYMPEYVVAKLTQWEQRCRE